MGKKSTRANKNIYQLSREAMGYTREKAETEMGYVSAERIEKIESEKSLPHPDEIMAMAQCYHAPQLCNYFCSHECPIGKEYVPEVEFKDLSQITLETLASLNTMEKAKNRFIEITVDNEVTEDELDDFVYIQSEMNKIAATVQSLKMWIDQTVSTGKIDKSAFKKDGQ